MQEIAFVAKLNQTNNIIMEMLQQNYDSDINFYSPAELLQEQASTQVSSPDLVLFDLNTSARLGNIRDHIKKLSSLFNHSPILIIHPYDHKSFIQPLIEAGARGIIPVAPKEDELTEAINEVLGGKSFISFS